MIIDAKKTINSNNSQRIEFAHALRGLAAFSVLISHFCGVFWLSPGAVAAILNVEAPTVVPPAFILPLHFSPYLNYGSFGVAVFFLISGFVIPFSLKKLSAPAFLIARAFRIYPVYIFSLCVSLGVVWLLGRYGGGKGVSYDTYHILAQASLTRGWFWIPSIDGVSWTLEIEIVFYLIAAIFSPFLLRSNYASQLLVGYAIATPVLCIIFINALNGASGITQTVLLYAAYALPFTVFMFIGTLFHLVSVNKITPSQLIFGVIACVWGFSVGAAVHPGLKSFSVSSYFIALGVFCSFWWTRESFKSNAILDRMADISYPLYAVHAVLGYSIMHVLSGFLVSPLSIIFCAALIVIASSALIHFVIERPTMYFGKKVAENFNKMIV